MNFLIRPPNLENITSRGIPRDFRDVRDYFNRALLENTLHYIPRRTRITDDEIRNLWLPNLNKNICFVAEDPEQQRVGGCITYFEDPLSTSYENASQRRKGTIAGTANPQYAPEEVHEINKGMLTRLIKELKHQRKTGILHLAMESPTRIDLKELRYEGTSIKREEYRKAGLGGEAMEYILP